MYMHRNTDRRKPAYSLIGADHDKGSAKVIDRFTVADNFI